MRRIRHRVLRLMLVWLSDLFLIVDGVLVEMICSVLTIFFVGQARIILMVIIFGVVYSMLRIYQNLIRNKFENSDRINEVDVMLRDVLKIKRNFVEMKKDLLMIMMRISEGKYESKFTYESIELAIFDLECKCLEIDEMVTVLKNFKRECKTQGVFVDRF